MKKKSPINNFVLWRNARCLNNNNGRTLFETLLVIIMVALFLLIAVESLAI